MLGRVANAARVCRAVVTGLSGARTIAMNAKDMFHKRLNVENVCRKFALSDDTLADVSRRITAEIDRGLQTPGMAFTGKPSTIRCLGTGLEVGPKPVIESKVPRFLSLDLTDGVWFRTRLTLVSDTDQVMSVSTNYPVYVKTGTGRGLFDRMDRRLAEFVKTQGFRAAAGGAPVMFKFGFPVRRTPSNAVVLNRWTKDFNYSDVIGRDVELSLKASLRRAGFRDVGPILVLNDASATLLNSLANVPRTRVGLVVSDGCNCCYVERTTNMHDDHRSGIPSAKCTVVNTEWGAFGEDGALKDIINEYDRSVDALSRYPRKQIFEKMTSGMYVAELVRKAVVELTEAGTLFGGHTTKAMHIKYILTARHLCLAAESSRTCRSVLENAFGVVRPSDFDCELFRYLCGCIADRSAHLIAAGLASVLRRVQPTDDPTAAPTVVAVSGTMFETHPNYANTVGRMTGLQLADERVSFELRIADHVTGAPLMAGMLFKMRETTTK